MTTWIHVTLLSPKVTELNMNSNTATVRIDRNLLEKLRIMAIKKHGKAHGSILAEINEAVRKYLEGGEVGEL